MTKKSRRIIFFICIILFLLIAPYIVMYSLGYRVDVANKKIVTTGGIYVKALPQGANVIIDSKINKKTGILSNAVFVQNLLPKQHTVVIKKEGFHDYQKTLEVKEREVTKLEHIILFKNNIVFQILEDKTQSPFNKKTLEDAYIIKNNTLYYSDIEENNQLSPTQKNTPIIKNIIAFKVLDKNIVWLSLDGFLYNFNMERKNTEKLSVRDIFIHQKNIYTLLIFNQTIFLKENDTLFIFDEKIKSFENFYGSVKNMQISPDRQKILYCNDHEILFSFLNSNNPEKIFLNRFSKKINECHWINNEYVIFSLENSIIISEIDKRGNINAISLKETISLQGNADINIQSQEILFNKEDGKLYILTQNTILVSEKLIP